MKAEDYIKEHIPTMVREHHVAGMKLTTLISLLKGYHEHELHNHNKSKIETKEQILQKHFTAEFGHDGHGKFMQYILDAMEEYAQQQVKDLNIRAVSRCKYCEHPLPEGQKEFCNDRCNREYYTRKFK